MSTNSMTIARDRILEAKKIQIAADTAGRELSAEESAKIFQLLDDAKARQKIAETEEISPRLTSAYGPGHRPMHQIIPQSEGNTDAAPLSRPAGKTFAAMFPGTKRSAGGFQSFDEYLRTIHSGLNDSRLVHASMTSISGSSGGFLVPTEYASAMLDAALEAEIVRPRCQVEPMTSDTKLIAGVACEDNSSSALYGGFSGQWLAEGAAATEQDAKFRAIQLHAHKLVIFTSASNELVADGTSFEQILGQAMIKAIAWHLDASCLTGDGAAKPRGVLNDVALITCTKETGQSAATLLTENVLSMFSRLHPSCVTSPSACWVANPTVIPQLYQLQIGIGTAGQPVFMPPNGLAGKPNATLLGLPLLFTEKLPALGTKGDLILADFSQFSLGIRQELFVEKSTDAGWANDLSRYRIKIRADGQGRWSKAFTPKYGNTLSWCVALETRS